MNPIIPFFFTLLLATTLHAQILTGRVISVSDGDTIKIVANGEQLKIRLYGIDTPERAQAYGQAAKKYTSALTSGKQTSVDVIDMDRYGRSVGLVKVGQVNVNEQVLYAGYAWVYDHYCRKPFCSKWKEAEKQARIAKRGLWADPHPIAPWDWRKGKKAGGSKKSNASVQPVASEAHHGKVKSHIYHGPGCRYYNCKNCAVVFN